MIPGVLIAVQYKANRIDKQKMQLNGLIKNVKSLRENKQYGLLLLASVVTLGTIVAFAMQSFFVLKTIMTDFLNFILKFVGMQVVITDTETLYGINLASAVISIAAGIFQSLCTGAMIFKLFQWNKEIGPYLKPFWQRSKGLFFAGIANNLVYSVVNALMTVICVQDSLGAKINSTAVTSFYNQSLFLGNASSALNCSQSVVYSTESQPSATYAWWVTAIAVLVAVAQAIPMFFNNLLYNFFVNIPKAESLEVALINHRLSLDAEQSVVKKIDNDKYRILRRGTKVRIFGDVVLPKDVEPVDSTVDHLDYIRKDVDDWIKGNGEHCNLA
jgi:hypothetical protein